MFFKIPTSSYLIPGPRLGFEDDICHLAIVGTIPDESNSVVLGQPFLENYFVVLDQEDMKIGLGEHLGSDAEISNKRFTDLRISVLMTLTMMALICFAMTLQCLVCVKKKYCDSPPHKDSYIDRSNSASSDDLVRSNSKEM